LLFMLLVNSLYLTLYCGIQPWTPLPGTLCF